MAPGSSNSKCGDGFGVGDGVEGPTVVDAGCWERDFKDSLK